MSKLNIAERRLPQDGRIQLKYSGREIDVRVSVIPMIHGEGIVMRLLDKGAMEFSLQGLGMNPGIYGQFSELIRLPHGIILVTGPTGSGKTTTLYSALTEIKDASTKIITTEDPVEYRLDGISQIQVHTKIGLTFAASLRSILRHDPDIVLVGEIRDLETAENAVQAALTGHLVFSTLHTNDAASAYTRLIDMGVEPFLVSSCVEAVMAQRLVRRLCPHCKEKYVPDKADMPPDFPWDLLQRGTGYLYRAAGCRECRQVGYRGRSGIYELLTTSNPIREVTGKNATAWEIKKLALSEGMTTLRMDAWRKALAGETSVEEVVGNTKQDEFGA
jgi:general secretion pathway protein E/type IV pilus assembly protein PilB